MMSHAGRVREISLMALIHKLDILLLEVLEVAVDIPPIGEMQVH